MNYHDRQQRIALYQDKDRLKTLQQLTKFKYEAGHVYSITYRLNGKGKSNYFNFNSVKYIPSIKSFTFNYYTKDYPSDELTDRVTDSITLKDYEITSYNKQNLNDSFHYLT